MTSWNCSWSVVIPPLPATSSSETTSAEAISVSKCVPLLPTPFMSSRSLTGVIGLQCLLYLWTLKIWYPNSFFLLRGHQERRRSNPNYAFKIECEHKYSERVYEACLGSFCALPLVAIIAERYFCVNGGISPELHTIDDIRKVRYFTSSLFFPSADSAPVTLSGGPCS